MAEPNLIYKIAVLNLLDKTDFPLSNQQITGFFLEGEYTDFFTAQQAISELENADLLEAVTFRNNTQYRMTEQGVQTLHIMRDKITDAIDEDADRYLQQHRIEMKKENSLTADYDKAVGGGYLVRCRMTEDKHAVMDLTFHVSSREQAETVCNNWKARHEEVYAALMDALIQ